MRKVVEEEVKETMMSEVPFLTTRPSWGIFLPAWRVGAIVSGFWPTMMD